MGYSGAGGKLIHEKNQKQKISWHCPFNTVADFFVPTPNGVNVFWFLLSLPLLPQATTAVFGSYPQSKELVRGPPELVQHFRL
jgi:hypothetical protein